jgi:flagellar L-ring protein precursor FlgH
MNQYLTRTFFNRIVTLMAVAALLSGCNMLQRLSDIGDVPKVTQIENPVAKEDYKPVVLPMPRPQVAQHASNSLWRPGARAFFKDQRASNIGDILTVTINISDEAKIENETTREREGSESAAITGLIGLETIIPDKINEIDMDNLAGIGTDSSSTGKGEVDRSEEIDLIVAAIVTQILPNGNLVISGSQEVVVNFEKRILQVTGVIRPEDIDATNKISHTQIAEARIVYGGRGLISDLQQPRYGQQFFDVVFPF